MRQFPCFSAIVEWENARLAGAQRAIRVLRELTAQTAELANRISGRPELIILFEKDAVPHEIVERAVQEACGSDAPFEIRVHATEGSDYYGQKNEGARLASREYVLFLDSDVVPDPGWLGALLGSVGPGVEVVAGSTYVDPATFFGRVFSLFWFFPLRPSTSVLQQSHFFYANNVIFRRDLFLAHQFPNAPLYRGNCEVLGNRLRASGIRLFLQTGARVAHAPPTPKHFIHRTLSEGHDAVIRASLAARPIRSDRAALGVHLASVRTRVTSRAPHLNVGRGELSVAMALSRAYCLLRFAGQRWVIRSPEGARRALGIRSVPLSWEGAERLHSQSTSKRREETADVR